MSGHCEVAEVKNLADAVGLACRGTAGKLYETRGESTLFNMKLSADGMPVDDLQAMLPALGVILPSGSSLQGERLSANLGVAGPVDKLVITGPIRLAQTKLAGFNLASKMSAISALSGAQTGQDTSIQNLSTDVRGARWRAHPEHQSRVLRGTLRWMRWAGRVRVLC